MRLALLITNTDDSAFAHQHPLDDQKFADLIHLVRPDWQVVPFWVKDGEFPDALDGIDGAIITGSPASVHTDAPWIVRLLTLIRQMVATGMPLFGACFGHQAIALALGGQVGRNPGGWIHGLTRNTVMARPAWAQDLPDEVKLYGSHTEQVTTLPDGAEVLTRSEGCPVSGFAIGTQVYTTQHHPEMLPGFIAALTEDLADAMGPEVADAARASLAGMSDMTPYAESIARFFEQAAQPMAASKSITVT